MGFKEKPWLVDISKRDDFKEITAKGGRVKSARKTQSCKERGSRLAKCKNCLLSFAIFFPNPELWLTSITSSISL